MDGRSDDEQYLVLNLCVYCVLGMAVDVLTKAGIENRGTAVKSDAFLVSRNSHSLVLLGMRRDMHPHGSHESLSH